MLKVSFEHELFMIMLFGNMFLYWHCRQVTFETEVRKIKSLLYEINLELVKIHFSCTKKNILQIISKQVIFASGFAIWENLINNHFPVL